MFQRLNDTPSVPDGVLVVPTLSAPCALRGLGAPVRMGAPLGGRPARPAGLRPGVLAGPRRLRPRPPLGAACGFRISVWRVTYLPI